MDDAKLRISKIDAARRQLDCAIELWFMDADEVSIHTLAAAAYQIVHDLKRHRGVERGLLYDAPTVRAERRREWLMLVKRAMNFFKHADNDPEETLDFRPIESLVHMLFCANGLRLIGEHTSFSANAFTFWIVINRQNWVTPEFAQLFIDRVGIEDLEEFRLVPKADFFELYRRASEAGQSVVQPD